MCPETPLSCFRDGMARKRSNKPSRRVVVQLDKHNLITWFPVKTVGGETRHGTDLLA